MRKRVSDISRMFVIAVFVAILLVGLFTFGDYGLSCDEIIERQSSAVNYRYINRVLLDRDVFSDVWPTGLSEYRDRYYGVTMQLPMIFAEDMVQLVTGAPMASETQYLMRHLYTFLIYYFALVCFYLLLKRLFESRWLAITGVLMVFLFGQFFAHSFYNIKDLLFASLFMITLCCAERMFATGRKPLWCLLFAISGTLLVTSRIVGAVLILLALACMLAQDIFATRVRKLPPEGELGLQQSTWKRLLPYLLICCAYPMWILVTPAAWSDPIGFSLGYIKTFSNYQDPTAAAAAAEAAAAGIVAAKTDTRFYFIKHIAASVPVITQLFSLLGIGAYAVRAASKKKQTAAKPANRMLLICMLLILLATLGYQALCQPNVYGGWRHAYYLYPILVVFAVYGLSAILEIARLHKLKLLVIAAVCMIVGSLLGNAVRIAVNHPYESAMNNIFARNTTVARERDYWRLTYYDLAKWVLDHTEGEARVCVTDPTGHKDWIVDKIILARLPDAEGARLSFGYLDESDYVLQNYAYVEGNDWPIEGFAEVYSIWVDGMKIAAVSQRTEAG